MKKKRRRFSTQFKLKVILESLIERQSVSELAQKHNLHPNQISKWKSDFIENASQYMTTPKEGKNDHAEREIEKLYEKIGRLQMENDYLKKKIDLVDKSVRYTYLDPDHMLSMRTQAKLLKIPRGKHYYRPRGM
ncbi:MAG: transposase, partial [Saprospiraceae bacterium]|nr:transposase [Saprospiraceae bacterium]